MVCVIANTRSHTHKPQQTSSNLTRSQRNQVMWDAHKLRGRWQLAKREIPLTERAALTLAGSLVRSRWAFAFTSKGGRKPLTRHYPQRIFRAMRSALGIAPDCVLHSTRHTFCTRLGNAGADAFTIQKLAGHSSITISQRYVQSDRVAKEAAIGMLDLLNRPSQARSDRVIS